ncbi:unnamed protein product [Ceratitis capitata]|uniref:(Mediterranean fruit fly) hypothetical protein n=1 Tax=Ceratitis capitata TaxID=7213 RepID=A0A811VBG4_CERCA|nr:unnamed protein product [Ceratitis capitata]
MPVVYVYVGVVKHLNNNYKCKTAVKQNTVKGTKSSNNSPSIRQTAVHRTSNQQRATNESAAQLRAQHQKVISDDNNSDDDEINLRQRKAINQYGHKQQQPAQQHSSHSSNVKGDMDHLGAL